MARSLLLLLLTGALAGILGVVAVAATGPALTVSVDEAVTHEGPGSNLVYGNR